MTVEVPFSAISRLAMPLMRGDRIMLASRVQGFPIAADVAYN